MSNSNGMYRVLDIFKKLEPTQEQQVKAEAKRIYESVEAKGSILEGVKTTEQKLQEKYSGFKEQMSESWNPADVADHVRNCIQKIHDEASNGIDMTDYIADELNDVFSDVRRSKDGNLKKAYAMMQDAVDASPEEQASIASDALNILGGLSEERETLKTKTGTIYKGGSYGTHYDVGDDGTKKVKHVPKKGVKGRPKKDPAPTYSQSNDPFGRVPDKAPKGKKGTVVKGKGNVDTVDEDFGTTAALAGGAALGAKLGKTAGIYRSAKGDEEAGLAKPRGRMERLKGAWKGISHPEYGDSDTIEKKYVYEGVNFSEMVKKHTVTLDEMMQQLTNDIMEFKRSGHVSDTLKDCMSVYEYGKQQLTDSAHTQHALDLNPDLKSMAQPQKPSVLGKVGDIAKKGLDVLTGPDDEGLMRDLARKTYNEEEELNELARLAGLQVKESNDGNLANNAKPYDKVTRGDVVAGRLGKDEQGGKKEVDEMWGNPYDDDKVDAINAANPPKTPSPVSSRDPERAGGPAIPVKHHTYDRKAVSSQTSGSDKAAYDQLTGREQMEEDDIGEGPEIFKLKADAAKKAGKKEFVGPDGKIYPVNESQLDECGMSPIGGMASDMEQQQGKISVNTNMSSDGHKSVNINADGDAAEQLMQMLKAAGIGSEQAAKHVQLVIAKPQATEEEMAEATDQYANTPEEEYEGVDAIVDQGADMNRQKRQFADKPKAGDNPMATPEGIDPVAELGRNLMQEYESLKLAK